MGPGLRRDDGGAPDAGLQVICPPGGACEFQSSLAAL